MAQRRIWHRNVWRNSSLRARALPLHQRSLPLDSFAVAHLSAVRPLNRFLAHLNLRPIERGESLEWDAWGARILRFAELLRATPNRRQASNNQLFDCRALQHRSLRRASSDFVKHIFGDSR